MSRRVRLRASARRNLDGIADYLADRSVSTALRFAAAVDTALARIAASPRVGRRRPWLDPLLGEVRSWPVPGFEDYLVIYRPAATVVDVLRVVHGARDLPSILEEE